MLTFLPFAVAFPFRLTVVDCWNDDGLLLEIISGKAGHGIACSVSLYYIKDLKGDFMMCPLSCQCFSEGHTRYCAPQGDWVQLFTVAPGLGWELTS